METRNLKFYIGFLSIVVFFLLVSWTEIPKSQRAQYHKINTLTRAEKKSGWRLLFDGKTFNGWRGLGRDHVPNGLWVIEGGLILL